MRPFPPEASAALLPPPLLRLLPGGAIQFPGGPLIPLWTSAFSRRTVMAFHEKAGPRQVDFDLSFLKFSLSFMAEGVQSGPERSRARSLRRQRTLDGEDRSVTIPPGRKGTVARDFWSCLRSSSAPKPTLSPPFHPHFR